MDKARYHAKLSHILYNACYKKLPIYIRIFEEDECVNGESQAYVVFEKNKKLKINRVDAVKGKDDDAQKVRHLL